MQPHERTTPVQVLIVDDEANAVKYFQKAFSGKYDIVTAYSADEAEEILFKTEHEIGVVVSDQRMPGRSGISLLSNVRKRRPDIVRILASAYCDLDSAIQAINGGEIFRYITKPWDLNSLEADLDQAVTFHIMQKECDLLLKEKLGAVQRTVLRDRVNNLACMSVLLSRYKNAPSTMYDYLKDTLAETSGRSAVKKQWAEMPAKDHWRLPVQETQRLMGLSEKLLESTLIDASSDDTKSDVVSIVSDCAQSLRAAHSMMSVSVQSDVEKAIVPAEATVLNGIMTRLMRSMSEWVAPGSTLLVRVGRDGGGAKAQTVVTFEMRNFNAAKAVGDCVLHTPPHQAASEQSVEYLRAALALGHLGGSISSPPAKNGFKQVQVFLPVNSGKDSAGMSTPSDWLFDLNEEYERWTLGMYDLAS